MKHASALSVLALIAAGVALSVQFFGDEGVEAEPVREHAVRRDDSLQLKVDELAQENRLLRERLSLLESRPTTESAPRQGADAVTRAEFDALRDEVRGLLDRPAPLASSADTEDDAFKEQVATTLSQIRKDEAVAKVRANHEKRVERIDETMPKIDRWLELTPQQSSEMRSALLAQYERDAELARRWEEGEDDEVLGEIKRTDREAHIADVSAFLTPAQLETYSSRRGK